MRSNATFLWDELLAATQGQAAGHNTYFEPVAIETDSRTLSSGCFFLPLVGKNFDGHVYIPTVYEMGATGAFVSAAYLEQNPQLRTLPNLIVVADTLLAYLALAQFHRERSAVKVIAVTGSSGKTTTKEMLYALLRQACGAVVQKSEKNYNNEVGVALTLLNVLPETQFLVLEMGMRGKNQINLLSRHAKPDIAVITNIGPAHIGLLGSLEAIAEAKCEIFEGLDPASGVAVINGDDPLLVRETPRFWSGYLETFSLHDVENVHTLPGGHLQFDYEDIPFHLGLPGPHNVMNMLACLKVCEILGIFLKKVTHALEAFDPGGGRWEKSCLSEDHDLWLINDAYNANPVSLKVSLAAFMETPFPGLQKVAIIGGMAELGSFSVQYHREIGEWLSGREGLSALVVLGDEAKPLAEAVDSNVIPTFWLPTHEAVAALIRQKWPEHALFFLKASRSFSLEDIFSTTQPNLTV